MRTKAALLVEQHHPLIIDEIEVPKLSYGQVLVRINATRICGSQLGEIDGAKGPDRFLPHLLGHEAGVEVLDLGPEVTQLRVGDHAVAHWRPGAGISAKSTRYQWGDKYVNAGPITTFSQLAVISENRLTPVAKNTDPEICALLADTITTGFGTINQEAQVKIGESVVVIGVGGIGLGAVLGAKLAGAFPLLAVDLQPHKLEWARQNGATHTLNPSEHPDLAQAIETAIGGKADVIIDCTGSPKVLQAALVATTRHGRVIGIGVMRNHQALEFNTLPLLFGKLLKGTEGGQSEPHIEIPRYLRMLQHGQLNLSHFVSHRVGLEEINQGIELLRSGAAVHCLVHCQ